MLGAHAPVGEDITLPACVTHAYAETHTLKYDVVRCLICSVMSTCSYRLATGLPTKALTAPPPTKRNMALVTLPLKYPTLNPCENTFHLNYQT